MIPHRPGLRESSDDDRRFLTKIEAALARVRRHGESWRVRYFEGVARRLKSRIRDRQENHIRAA